MIQAPEILPHTEAHPLADGEVRLLGAVRQVTGAFANPCLDRVGLPSEDTTVLFVGYQAEGTPGRRIQNAARNQGTVYIDGEEVKVRAKVETLSGLSAHADRKELLAWLRHIPDVSRVALHHGDVEAQEAFAAWVSTQ